MSVSYINQVFNGACAALFDDFELMLAAIAEKYDLPVEDLRTVAYAASDDQKGKAIKLQKRQPKRTGGVKKERKVGGYTKFAEDKRDVAKALLINDEAERTFIGAKGNEITLEISEKGPDFVQITRKVASMWDALTEEEKDVYKARALKEGARPKKVVAKKGRGKAAVSNSSSTGSSSTGSASTDVSDAEASVDPSSESSAEKTPPPKRGNGKAKVEAKPETKAPPKKKGAEPAKPPAKKPAAAKKGGK